MEFTKLKTDFRTLTGKGVARRMRQKGRTPGVVYGQGMPTVAVSLVPKELIHALSGPLRVNTPLDITIEGGDKDTPKQVLAIVKDHQYEPVTRDLLHVDFLAITESTPIDMKVPLHTSGRSKGEQLGGVLTVNMRDIPITCTAACIPAGVTVDVSALNLLESISVKDLPLPEGVSVRLPPERHIVTITASRALEDAAAAAAEAAKKD